ncbi:hypothetical protein MMA231_02466 [Asticcacaulis sp. MM231]|uniref:ATP-binding protein n=1 Tax=Asticcacaulis sp. MM231 TaxID=3157666 RepID=UPI0032D5A363
MSSVENSKSSNEVISEIISSETLPQSGEFLVSLQDENGLFTEDEGILHDYKDEFPFSSSDGYFGGILRLICGFNNTFGGLIIFGVDDKSRRAGKNKVTVDSEKVNRKLRENLSQIVTISCRKYRTRSGDVDVVLIPKRKTGVPPVRLAKVISNYSPSKIYKRAGAEVLDAAGIDLEFLYGPRPNPFIEEKTEVLSIDAALPGSPATIDEFVGRFQVMERAMEWLTSSREPRLFLWGHGGSGKSTIAYEFAKIVAGNGKLLYTVGGKQYERVIYVSAKNSFLDPFTAKIEKYKATDFSSSVDLFKSLLYLSNWTDQSLDAFDEAYLLKELEDLLEIETQLIIIDDIDSLSSANEDNGMEQLFTIAARCRSETKVLYTQRNLPVYARRNSIEIPGLDQGDELPIFISLCSKQFGVPAPDEVEALQISKLSECRPLAVETIIGLRRITSSYSQAMQRWTSDASQAREYLFQREYDQLSKENRGRYLLAALCAFARPQGLGVLQQVLSFKDEQLQDAIAETRDMFLKVEYGTDGGDQYSLGAATSSFIQMISKKLDKFPAIEARVKHYLSKSSVTPPSLLVLLERANRQVDQGQAESAWTFLNNTSLPPAVTEHQAFKATLGRVAASLKNPRLGEARQAFEEAYGLGNRDHKMYLDWLGMEKAAGAGTTNGIEVCIRVVNGSGFTSRTTANFFRHLAYLQMKRAIEISDSSPEESERLKRESLKNNINGYNFAKKSSDRNLENYYEQIVDTFKKVAISSIKNGTSDQLLSTIEDVLQLADDPGDILPIISINMKRLADRVQPHSRLSVRRSITRIQGRLSQKGFCATSDAEEKSKFHSALKAMVSGLS